MCEVRRTKWDIPQKTIQEIIELFPYLESVSWQGGEPFLLEYFEGLFDQAKRFDLKQTIVTNGTLINENWAEKLVKNNVELTFSIDGITKEVYEHIRERAKFDDVIRSLKIIRKARNKYDSRRMTLRLHVVIMKSNYHQLEEFIDFAKEYEFNAVHIISMWGNPDSEENIFHRQDSIPLHYIQKIRSKVEEKAKRFNISLLNDLPAMGDNSSPDTGTIIEDSNNNNVLLCYLPWQQLNIDPGGGVRPGCICIKTAGNILESSIKDLWNSELMQTYRKRIISRDYLGYCNHACLSGQISQQLRGL
jgi:MoaA/NifB/PqqE/SkfB family radical SAM enzyme